MFYSYLNTYLDGLGLRMLRKEHRHPFILLCLKTLEECQVHVYSYFSVNYINYTYTCMHALSFMIQSLLQAITFYFQLYF